MVDFEVENYLLSQIYMCSRLIVYYKSLHEVKACRYWSKRLSINNDMLEEFRNFLKEKEND